MLPLGFDLQQMQNLISSTTTTTTTTVTANSVSSVEGVNERITSVCDRWIGRSVCRDMHCGVLFMDRSLLGEEESSQLGSTDDNPRRFEYPVKQLPAFSILDDKTSRIEDAFDEETEKRDVVDETRG